MTRKTLAVTSIALIALVLAGNSIRAARSLPIASHPAHESVVALAQDTRSLKEKAKQTRNFSDSQNPKDKTVYENLAALANHSAAVIIGTPQRNLSVLSRDGNSISLNYAVSVEYVYKGKLQPGNTVTVSLPGGKIKFDDGSTAEVTTHWFKKMQNGKTYALFLQPGTGNAHFVTTGEAQGVFEIPTTQNDRTVKSHSGIQGQTVRKYDGRDVKAFLRELRQVTGKPLKN
jgi:hypothetical protein